VEQLLETESHALTVDEPAPPRHRSEV
jgi:hypothetical protein